MSSSDFQRTAAKRLSLCFDMFELGSEMKLRREHPEARTDEVEARYKAWLHERPGAEHGDGAGRPVDWPRQRE